jgi:hypothetical protein
MIDAVLSYHANPDTCGVTKFNVQLAEKLGVPHDVLSSGRRYRHPLVSIKTSEMNDDTADGWWMNKIPLPPYDLLLHDRPDGHLPPRVLYADELGCPSTLRGDSTRKGLTILSFGMAHKFQAPLFEKLKAILDATATPTRSACRPRFTKARRGTPRRRRTPRSCGTCLAIISAGWASWPMTRSLEKSATRTWSRCSTIPPSARTTRRSGPRSTPARP